MKPHLVLLFLAACGGRSLDHDEPSRPVPDAPIDGDLPCAATCNGACVDLETDDDNCGACGHECRAPEIFGPCEEGSCPAALWCNDPSEYFGSCNDVCAFYGQRCIDGPPQDRRVCGGEHMFFQSSAIDFDACEDVGESYYSYGLECGDGIDWSVIRDTEPFYEAVACCCTQELPT